MDPVKALKTLVRLRNAQIKLRAKGQVMESPEAAVFYYDKSDAYGYAATIVLECAEAAKFPSELERKADYAERVEWVCDRLSEPGPSSDESYLTNHDARSLARYRLAGAVVDALRLGEFGGLCKILDEEKAYPTDF